MRTFIFSVLVLVAGYVAYHMLLILFMVSPTKVCTFVPVAALSYQYCYWSAWLTGTKFWVQELGLGTIYFFLVLGSVLTFPSN